MRSRLCDIDKVIPFREEYTQVVRRILGELYNRDNYPKIGDRVRGVWEKGGYVATVGDRVTFDLIGLGFVPDLAFIDRREKRGDAPDIDLSLFNGYDIVVNEKGTINMGLCKLIRSRLRDRPWLFLVEGEEDLVGFPVVIALPLGSAFIYGAPDLGAVFVEISEEIKNEAVSLINRLLEALGGPAGEV